MHMDSGSPERHAMNDDDSKFNRRFLAYFAVGLCIAAMAYVAAITFRFMPERSVYAYTLP